MPFLHSGMYSRAGPSRHVNEMDGAGTDFLFPRVSSVFLLIGGGWRNGKEFSGGEFWAVIWSRRAKMLARL